MVPIMLTPGEPTMLREMRIEAVDGASVTESVTYNAFVDGERVAVPIERTYTIRLRQ